jgi:pimeloyl-ACP methyl ester carboxylesterase
MESLAIEHRVYALDLWGFGDSDKSDRRFTMDQYISLIADFIDELGIVSPVIVGHSLGAAIAIEYASRYEGVASKIVAVSLPLDPKSIDRRLMSYTNSSVLSRVFRWKPIPIKEIEQEADRAAENVIPLSLESFAQSKILEKLLVLQCSVLLVYGDKDDVIDPTPMRDFNSGLQNIKQISLSSSRHFPMIDEGGKFNRLVKDFAAKNATLETLGLKEEWRRRIR